MKKNTILLSLAGSGVSALLHFFIILLSLFFFGGLNSIGFFIIILALCYGVIIGLLVVWAVCYFDLGLIGGEVAGLFIGAFFFILFSNFAGFWNIFNLIFIILLALLPSVITGAITAYLRRKFFYSCPKFLE